MSKWTPFILPRYNALKLPHNCIDLERKQGTLEGIAIAEKTRGVPGTRTTNRANWFQKRKGTRDHIANLRRMMERAREHQQYLYMCVVNYKRPFDCIDHERT